LKPEESGEVPQSLGTFALDHCATIDQAEDLLRTLRYSAIVIPADLERAQIVRLCPMTRQTSPAARRLLLGPVDGQSTEAYPAHALLSVDQLADSLASLAHTSEMAIQSLGPVIRRAQSLFQRGLQINAGLLEDKDHSGAIECFLWTMFGPMAAILEEVESYVMALPEVLRRVGVLPHLPDKLLAEGLVKDLGFIAQEGRAFEQVCSMLIAEIVQGRKSIAQEFSRDPNVWGVIEQTELIKDLILKSLRLTTIEIQRLVDPSGALKVPFLKDSDLETSREVRAALCDLRRIVLGLIPENVRQRADVEAVTQKVMQLLDSLFGQPVCTKLRARDRQTLKRFRRQLEDPQCSAKDVLADLRSFSELLVGVNNRVQLVVHDDQVQQKALASLLDVKQVLLHPDESKNGWELFSELLEEMEDLRWRRDDFDIFVHEVLKRPLKSEALVGEIERAVSLVESVAVAGAF